MAQLIKLKFEQCPEYKEALLASGNDVIAEAVPYEYSWSSGLEAKYLYNMPPCAWPGDNKMGKLHIALRESLSKEIPTDTIVLKRKMSTFENDEIIASPEESHPKKICEQNISSALKQKMLPPVIDEIQSNPEETLLKKSLEHSISTVPECEEDVPKDKYPKNSCFFPECTVMFEKYAKHFYERHMPKYLRYKPENPDRWAFMFRFILDCLKLSSISDLLKYVHEKNIAQKIDAVTLKKRDTDMVHMFAKYLNVPICDSYEANEINCVSMLIHWRVLVQILSTLSDKERNDVHKLKCPRTVPTVSL